MIFLIGLGSLFAIMAMYAVSFMSLGLGLIYGFVSLLCFGCSALMSSTIVEPPQHRHEEQRNRNQRTGGSSRSSDSEGYTGHNAGDIIDLGGGDCFDIHEPEELLSRSCWQRDNQGGYYNYATGESVTYNNGVYRYNEAPEEEDDSDSYDSSSDSDDEDDDSGSGWSLF